jgi:hypothetical protein
MIVSSCSSDHEEWYNQETEIAVKRAETKGMVLDSRFEVLDETSAVATIYDRNTHEVIGHEILHRYSNGEDLGRRETSEYGSWEIVGETNISDPVVIGTHPGEDPLFVVTRKSFTVTSTITNGEVEFNPHSEHVYDDCTWSNGDTTIVFNIHWDVKGEMVTIDGSVVTDRLETSFCEYKQEDVVEVGTLVLASTPNPARRFALDALSTVTLDPDHTNGWLVGYSIATVDSTATLAVALEQNGEVVAFNLVDGTDAANNGAFFIEKKGNWFPAIAADRNDGMSWSVGKTEITMISYSKADHYPNWGNNNKTWKGQNSVELREYSYKENPEDETITFFFNGSEAGVLSYADLF